MAFCQSHKVSVKNEHNLVVKPLQNFMTDDFMNSNFHDLNKKYFSDNNLLTFVLEKTIVCFLFCVATSKVFYNSSDFFCTVFFSFPKSFSEMIKIDYAYLK